MNGVYGTVKPAYLTPTNITSDVEILYAYRENRGSEQGSFTSVDSGETYTWLSPVEVEVEEDRTEIVPGAFNLRLPMSIFSAKGIYTVYIKPREIKANILDVGVLSEYPDVRGLVFKISPDNTVFNVNGALVGYRVEYFGLDDASRSEDYTIITSSNKCAAIIQNVMSTNQKAVRYRFDDSSNLLFCTVSPSTSPSFNSNTLPYIGRSGEYVRLVNTKFEPIMVEVELVENDADTLSVLIGGNQIRNLDNGIITTYNEDNEIYKQVEYMVKKTETGKPLYEIKQNRDSIYPQDFDEIVNLDEI